MEALLVQALRDLPLALVREDLSHRRNLINVHEVLRPLRQHDSYLQRKRFDG